MTAALGKSIIASLAFVIATAEARVIVLKPGVTVVSTEYIVREGDTLRGASGGSTLRASSTFKGRAIVVLESRTTIEGLSIDGNRAKLGKPMPIAPYDRAFADFYPNNGILSVGTEKLVVRNVTLRNIANFAVLISGVRGVSVTGVKVYDSGSLSDKGRNNTTGGILFEEGTFEFSAINCVVENVSGNGIWTHSRMTSPRNETGSFENNTFRNIGRDALQVGHATEVGVIRNSGSLIGYPHKVVDVEGGGMPVAIDTAGNVENSWYEQNRFEEINGKCIDLDGFHDGIVQENTCINRGPATAYPSGHFGIVFNNTNPHMESVGIRVIDNVIDGTKFGGIFVIGRNHTIRGNRLLRLNLAGCNESHQKFGCIYNAEEPEILQTGIYLGRKAERPDPARENTITGNVISGFRMKERCVATAPGVEQKTNTIEANDCRNQ
ncbi:MAG TPA: right-handed parallel beta-helix repeat-containing protein [Bryobacteraceae bacterium]|nr:right-handed parallel beta-helix repeat-containing protein [Bryobacteraceae bacterium]